MNNGLAVVFFALVLAGCLDSTNNSSKISSELKLINNMGYVSYRVDDGSWVEIRDDFHTINPSTFNTLHLIDICLNEGVYIDFKVSILSANSVKDRASSNQEIELGCHEFSSNESPISRFTLSSAHPDIALQQVAFSEMEDYSETGIGNNKSFIIGSPKQSQNGKLFVIGENDRSEYFLHFRDDFSFLDGNTYNIDFFDNNSVQAIAEKQDDPENYKYSRSIILDDFFLPLSPISNLSLYLRPQSEDFFPNESVYIESWSTRTRHYDMGLSVSSNSSSLDNENPLPNLLKHLSELSITYNKDGSINIDQSPSTNSFIGLPTEHIFSYLRFNGGVIRYENTTTVTSDSYIASMAEYYSLPNFPEDAKLDMNTAIQGTIYITKSNGISDHEVGRKSYSFEKVVLF